MAINPRWQPNHIHPSATILRPVSMRPGDDRHRKAADVPVTNIKMALAKMIQISISFDASSGRQLIRARVSGCRYGQPASPAGFKTAQSCVSGGICIGYIQQHAVSPCDQNCCSSRLSRAFFSLPSDIRPQRIRVIKLRTGVMAMSVREA